MRARPPHARKVLVIGSLNLDTIVRVASLPGAGETVLARETRYESGGKSMNQAASAALLGADVALVGVVGSDPDGARLLNAAAAYGVDTTAIVTDPDRATGTAIVMVDDDGENSIIVSTGANDALTPALVSPDQLAGKPIVVLALESPLAAVTEIARTAHAEGCEVLLNASPVQKLPATLLASTTLLVVNKAEAEKVTGVTADADWTQTQAALRKLGIQRAIVTLGADGAAVLDGDRGITLVPPVPVVAVDTTGCGDAFMGAVAAELALGGSLVEAAQSGARAGAWAARGLGAQPSYGTREDLASLVDGV